jgi:hypothetical protein
MAESAQDKAIAWEEEDVKVGTHASCECQPLWRFRCVCARLVGGVEQMRFVEGTITEARVRWYSSKCQAGMSNVKALFALLLLQERHDSTRPELCTVGRSREDQ